MKNFEKVFAIGAHPDDIEFSCLGYLLRLKNNGANISIYVASNGSKGDPTSSSNRIDESKLALKNLEANLYYNNFSGISNNNFESLTEQIRSKILKFKPDLILIHSQYDTHQEHKLIREISISACRRYPCTLISFKSPSVTSSFNENYFVDISDYLDTKISMIRMHKSRIHHDYMRIDFLKNFHINWFSKIRGFKYVESYYLEQYMI